MKQKELDRILQDCQAEYFITYENNPNQTDLKTLKINRNDIAFENKDNNLEDNNLEDNNLEDSNLEDSNKLHNNNLTKIHLQDSFLHRINTIEESLHGLILFTSGTSGRPKGVVHTHKSLKSQLDSLSTAWQWSNQDHILQILPLNHIHGLQCVLNCSLYNGALCEMFDKFEVRSIWSALLRKPN